MNLKKKKRPSTPSTPSIPKRLGKSKVRKSPARDEKHLAKVRKHPCLICARFTPIVYASGRANPVRAHHARELFPRTMGRQISDYLTIPLCELHHSDQSPWDSIHKHNNIAWWHTRGIDPAAWIAAFSKEGRQAIEQLQRR